MKKLIHASLLAVFAIILPIYGASEKEVMGSAEYTDKTFDVPLKIMGTLTAKDLKAPQAHIFGWAKLTGTILGETTIQGPLQASHSTFTGPVKVYGNVETASTEFKQELTVYGDEIKVVLEDTKATDITLDITGSTKKTSSLSWDDVKEFLGFGSKKGAQKVENTEKTQQPAVQAEVILKGNTVVTGTITFTGGKGTVKTEDTAQHLGDVIGEAD